MPHFWGAHHSAQPAFCQAATGETANWKETCLSQVIRSSKKTQATYLRYLCISSGKLYSQFILWYLHLSLKETTTPQEENSSSSWWSMPRAGFSPCPQNTYKKEVSKEKPEPTLEHQSIYYLPTQSKQILVRALNEAVIPQLCVGSAPTTKDSQTPGTFLNHYK